MNWQRWRIPIALGLVMLLQVGMFIHVHAARWEEVIEPLKQPPEREGEGLVIRGNGLGYYAWLRSLLIDGDLDFANEFDEHGVKGDWVPPPSYLTPLGMRANQWSIGPACFWAIFIVPGHYIIKAIDPAAATGYTLPYQLLIGVAGLIAALVGLICLYGICRQLLPSPSGRGQGEGNSRAALATAFMTLGSTLTCYWSVEVSMAHGLGASALALYVWYWLRTYGSFGVKRWALVGFLLGITCLMRWQLATFAVLPLSEALLTWWRTPATPRSAGERGQGQGDSTASRRAVLLFIAALAAFIAFLPQMIAWKYVYGHWVVEPVPQIAHHWLNPALWQVLLSQDRSLLYWTPICAVAFLGYFAALRSVKCEQLILLFVSLVIQIYVIASVWGQGAFSERTGNYAGAFLSHAYGMRHLNEAIMTLGPALAALLDKLPRVAFVSSLGLAGVLTIANFAIIDQYACGLLPHDEGVPPAELIGRTIRFLRREPWTLLGMAEIVALICLLALWPSPRQEKTGNLNEK